MPMHITGLMHRARGEDLGIVRHQRQQLDAEDHAVARIGREL